MVSEQNCTPSLTHTEAQRRPSDMRRTVLLAHGMRKRNTLTRKSGREVSRSRVVVDREEVEDETERAEDTEDEDDDEEEDSTGGMGAGMSEPRRDVSSSHQAKSTLKAMDSTEHTRVKPKETREKSVMHAWCVRPLPPGPSLAPASMHTPLHNPD